MTSYTENYSIPSPDGTDGVVVHTDLKKAVDKVDEVIKNANDRVDATNVNVESARFYRGSTPLTTSDVFDNLASGIYTVWNGDVAESLGFPERSQSSVEIHRWGAAGGVATLRTRTLIPHEYLNVRLSGGWTGWTRTDAGAVASGSGGESSGSSGTKTVPLAITLGHGGGVNSPISGTVVIPTDWNAPITRWRIAVRDGNPRFGVANSNPTTFTNVKANGVVQLPSVSMPAGTDVFYFPWVAGNPSQSIEYTYSASVAPYGQVGGGTIGGAAQTYLPFEMWVEVEVPSNVPVIAVGGDSNACGVGTTNPVHDSWLSVYCRRIGALPVHYAASGDSYAGWAADDAHHKWTRWDHLSKPDVIINAWGSNDAGVAGTTIADVQANAEIVWNIAAQKVSPNQQAITLKPRNSGDANYQTVRKAYNAWVKTKPLGLRDWHDMVTPVSSDDATILPAYDSGDGTHMNTAGHQELADSITKTVTVAGAMPITEDPADPGFYLIGG